MGFAIYILVLDALDNFKVGVVEHDARAGEAQDESRTFTRLSPALSVLRSSESWSTLQSSTL